MKILGFADKGVVKTVIRNAGLNPVSVRKAVISPQGFIEVYFHNGDKMQKVDAPQFIPKPKEKK